MDEIFRKIWHQLRKSNKDLFPTESYIKDSAIYKASPLHKLTDEQKAAQNLILEKYIKHLIMIKHNSLFLLMVKLVLEKQF